MSITREDDNFIFPCKLSSSDFSFVYVDYDYEVVGFLLPTTQSEDTPEAEITDEDVVDTMGDYMMEAMECKNCHIYDESDSSCGEEHEMNDETYSLSGVLDENIIDKIYIQISELINGKKDLVEGNNIVYFSDAGLNRG